MAKSLSLEAISIKNAFIKAGANEARYYNSDTALQIAELMPIGRISSVKIMPIMDKKFLRFEKEDNVTLFYGTYPDGKLGIPLARDLRAERYFVELNNVVTRGDKQYIGSIVVSEAKKTKLKVKTDIIRYNCSSEAYFSSTRYMLPPPEVRLDMYFPFNFNPHDMVRLFGHVEDVFARPEAAFREAAERAYDGVIPLYIKLGINVNSQDSEGNTAAHKAAGIGTDNENPHVSGHLSTIYVLARYGADFTIPNNKGQKVIEHASVKDLLRLNYGYVPESEKAA
jgi:hypothetical protein